MILWLLQLLLVWIAFCVLAALAAGAFYFQVDRRLAAERENALTRAERLLSRMRLQGLDEEVLRQFVCKYSGQHWEEFFEALFGYVAKLAARTWSRGEAGRHRQQFASWRDPLVRWIDSRLQTRREAKDRKHLQAVEEKALKDKGVAAEEARQQALQVADAMVSQVAELKEALGKAAADKAQLRALLAAAKKPEGLRRPAGRRRSPMAILSDYAFAPRLRFLAGGLLVTTCLLWMNQNDLFSTEKLRELAESTMGMIRASGTETDAAAAPQFVETTSLDLPGLPSEIADLLGNFNAGVAGLILLLTSLCRGWKIGLSATLAAAVTLLGHLLPLPTLPPLTPEGQSLALGLACISMGLLLFAGRRQKAQIG
jgi:hypothetical protein